jgi:hypothetical protein
MSFRLSFITSVETYLSLMLTLLLLDAELWKGCDLHGMWIVQTHQNHRVDSWIHHKDPHHQHHHLERPTRHNHDFIQHNHPHQDYDHVDNWTCHVHPYRQNNHVDFLSTLHDYHQYHVHDGSILIDLSHHPHHRYHHVDVGLITIVPITDFIMWISG